MVTKRNHYVPRFYLEKFVDPDSGGVVWVYDKEGGDPRPQKAIDTAVESYLYTIRQATGGADDSLERFFAALEGETKPILDRWLQPKARILEEEKPIAAKFLAFLHTRVPRTVAMATEMSTAMARAMIGQLVANPERFKELYDGYIRETGDTEMPPVEEMREAFADFDSRFTLETNRQFALWLSLHVTDDFYKTLFELNWSIIDAPTGAFFVTGDAPVVSIALFDDGQAQFGCNYVHPNFQVTFPLSPHVSLYLSRQPRQARWRCRKDLVQEVNRRTAYMAERFVYSHLRSRSIAGLVSELAHTRETPKLDQDEFREYARKLDLISGEDGLRVRGALRGGPVGVSTAMDELVRLIQVSYSKEEADRHLNFNAARRWFDKVKSIGEEILAHSQQVAGACALMSAVWVALTRDRLGLPAYCVAGDLLVSGQIVFGGIAGTAEVATVFDQSNPAWDGHCWLSFGEYVGDLSLFRTAYSSQGPKALQQVVLEQFGSGRGLLLSTTKAAEKAGLVYVPKYVLTGAQVDGLFQGARAVLAPADPPSR